MLDSIGIVTQTATIRLLQVDGLKVTAAMVKQLDFRELVDVFGRIRLPGRGDGIDLIGRTADGALARRWLLHPRLSTQGERELSREQRIRNYEAALALPLIIL